MQGITYTKREKSQITGRKAENTCTTGITDMSALFENDKEFNGYIRSWETRDVRDMTRVFARADNFNQPIQAWDTSQVRRMDGMFQGAGIFDQN